MDNFSKYLLAFIIDGMYEIGTHLDLSYLNGGATKAATKSTPPQFQAEVGTHFTFRSIGDTFKAYRSIPVAFA